MDEERLNEFLKRHGISGESFLENFLMIYKSSLDDKD